MDNLETTEWWKTEDSDRAAQQMHTLVNAIEQNTSGIHYGHMQALKLYTDQDLDNFSLSQHLTRSYYRPTARNPRRPIYWNVVKSATDSIVSKLGKDKVRPSALTNGSWIEQQNRAKKWDDFIFGTFQESGLYKWGRATLKNMVCFGTCFGYFYSEYCYQTKKYKVKYERVFPDEILVDPYDGLYCDPQTIYRRKNVSRADLIKLGLTDTQIDNLPTDSSSYGEVLRTSKTYRVYAGWHLPAGEEKGRHIIECQGVLIHDEEWKRPRFPFAIQRYTTEPLGFWGTGLASELYGDQSEINRVLNFIKNCFIISSNPRTYIHNSSNISKQQISNRIGGIINWSGTIAPVTVAPQSVSPEIFAHLDRLWARAYEKVGLNQLMVSGRNELGAGASGVAFREHNDIQSERFAETQMNWEQFHVDSAQIIDDEVQEIVDKHGKYVVSVSSEDKGIFELDYNDVKLPKDSYAIQVFPRSVLPKTPGGRLEWISEMTAKGYLDKETSKELLDFPDLKSNNMLEQRHNIRQIIEKNITQDFEKGKDPVFFGPIPQMNLPLAVALSNGYVVMLHNELPEDTEDQREDKAKRIDLAREFGVQATKLIEEAQAKAMPEQGQGMPMPEQGQGMPMPTPMG